MIGYLQGKTLSKNPDQSLCVLLAGSVGYEVAVSRRTFESLNIGEETQLWIHTAMKENSFALYGFANENEKLVFKSLLSVSGLGPKGALSLLSEHGSAGLSHLILAKDATAISKAPGIGKKSAQRIVLDLRTKVEKWNWIQSVPGVDTPLNKSTVERPLMEDLALALEHLGYAPGQVKPVLDRLSYKEDLNSLGFETSLKKLLAELSGRNLPKGQELGS